MRKPVILLVLLLVLGSTSAAHAVEHRASGSGQSHLSAAIGFVAKSDLTGHFTYVSDDGAFKAKCNDYTLFRFLQSNAGVTSARLGATCEDQDKQTVYLQAAVVDRGEPGVNDSHCIGWSYTQPPKFPMGDSWEGWFIMDHGVIESGNINVI